MSLREMTVNWIDTILDEVWGEDAPQVPGEDVWWLPGTMPRRIEVEGHGEFVTIEVSAAARHGVERTADVLEALHDQTLTHLLGDAVLLGEWAVARIRLHAHEASRPALQRALDLATHMSADVCAAREDLPGGGECAEGLEASDHNGAEADDEDTVLADPGLLDELAEEADASHLGLSAGHRHRRARRTRPGAPLAGYL